MQPSDSSYSSLEIEQRAEFIFAKRAVFVSDVAESGERRTAELITFTTDVLRTFELPLNDIILV